MRTVPLLDLRPQNEPLAEEIAAAIAVVIRSQRYILGEDVAALEREMATYLSAPYAIGCASGTDALVLALLAIDLQPGDRVLTSPFSFFATAGAIVRAGGIPVFADIDPRTFNLSPEQLQSSMSGGRIKAVIPVHLFGGCADMDPILSLAHQHGWYVIEDAAQAIGAEYKGRKATALGDLGCLSFFPSKNLGAFGDAGLVTAKDGAIAARVTALRVHGTTEKYRHEWVGLNSRIDTLQAAVLRVKLRHVDDWTAARQKNVLAYRQRLVNTPVTLPEQAPYQTRHICNQFVIRCPDRDRLKQFLAEQGIGTEVYYPIPLHLQPCFRELGYRPGDFPESERTAQEVLALPIYPGLALEDIEYVAGQITEFYRRS